MLEYLTARSEWANRRIQLINEHHQERTYYFRLEEDSWKALENAHVRQRIQLSTKPYGFRAQVALIKKQVQFIAAWRAATLANRSTIETKQDQEIINLDLER